MAAALSAVHVLTEMLRDVLHSAPCLCFKQKSLHYYGSSCTLAPSRLGEGSVTDRWSRSPMCTASDACRCAAGHQNQLARADKCSWRQAQQHSCQY